MKPYITLFLLLANYLSFSQDKGDFVYEDKIYDDYFRTVQLYPEVSVRNSSNYTSDVISLKGSIPLVLEFDELYADAYSYKVKIIHCNSDWSPSGLSPLQYLADYNEYDINDLEYSFGTITPYVHYKFKVPKPTISGNYLLVVYAGSDLDDVVITKRFMVYEQRVTFPPKNDIINSSPHAVDKQHLHFNIDYSSTELLNPMERVNVTIRQNQRWDNAKINIKPTYVKELQNVLQYSHYSDKTAFLAGNEFRYFDIRSLKYFGFHIEKVKFGKDRVLANVETDKPRAGLAYSIERNMKGQYRIENLERKIARIENDYAMVNFSLESEELGDNVYVSGKFTNWIKNGTTRLKYNPATNRYEGAYLLKQGIYDYQYVVDSKKRENDIEGNKRETKNTYDILVYYFSQELNADLLIGYYTFIYNSY
ncbi:MAG: type IX secretion system plug protein domain-containing protein [Bacteroidota bacterium]